jgi:hypothetical protein
LALTRFVRNVDDLSDDGGYKFRFHCDTCGDGVESQYVGSSANVLKTGLQIFQMFRYLGWGRTAVDGIDRGLRGKEHDAAFEKAVNEAMVSFSKCSHCGSYSCEHCWNGAVGMCERCAPDAGEAAAIAAAQRTREERVAQTLSSGEAVGVTTCLVCSRPTGAGRFCQHCGTPTTARDACPECRTPAPAGAHFCGECGTDLTAGRAS